VSSGSTALVPIKKESIKIFGFHWRVGVDAIVSDCKITLKTVPSANKRMKSGIWLLSLRSRLRKYAAK